MFRYCTSRFALFGLLAAAALLAGCVQRRLIVRSNPPGARVIVDDTYEMGITPVAFNYTYYGTRKIKLIRDGYETLTVYQALPAPWYQWPGLDFITENLIPWEIRDERVVEYQLRPQAVVPTAQLLQRAQQLRRQSHPGGLPAPVASPPRNPAPSGPRPAVPGPSDSSPYVPPGGFGPPGNGPPPGPPATRGGGLRASPSAASVRGLKSSRLR